MSVVGSAGGFGLMAVLLPPGLLKSEQADRSNAMIMLSAKMRTVVFISVSFFLHRCRTTGELANSYCYQGYV